MMKPLNRSLILVLPLLLMLSVSALAQITPLADSYTNTAASTTNYGARTTINVDGATQTGYIQFDLSEIPSGATVSKAMLKLYVNTVNTAGSFNVDYVNGAWTETTIDASNAPALGGNIASNVTITKASKSQYIQVDVTTALQAWLSGSQINDGVALVADGATDVTFDSKENISTSHAPELDIVFGGNGTITGVTTADGSGLSSSEISGNVNLSLSNACAQKQVLQWNGDAWACTSVGTGTITSVGAGTALTGGGTSGAVTLNVDTTQVPLLSAGNTFTTSQYINGSLTASGANFTGQVSSATSGITGLFAQSTNSNATTVYGIADASSGEAWGVQGITNSGDSNAYGVFGLATSTSASGSPIGVYGQSLSGTGAFGEAGTGSALQTVVEQEIFPFAGVWGDSSGAAGVAGTSDSWVGGYFANDISQGPPALAAVDFSGAGFPFQAISMSGGGCIIDAAGDLSCSGTKNAVVPIDGGKRKVALSAIESPVNWFEDAGEARLENGAAVVMLDGDFIQTVNTNEKYQVFLTPYGDCKGLYVRNRTANSFEVHELGSGAATLSFGYRIMALRKNYETVRFADHTNDPDPLKLMRTGGTRGKPESHDPVKKAQPAAIPARMSAERPVAAR
jgi:hypothetical protein